MGEPCMVSATDPCTNGPGTTLILCGEPSVGVITYACVHEHIDTPRACAGCAAEMQRAAGFLICPRCEDGPGSHECLVDVRITRLDGTVTIVQEARSA